MDSARQDLQRVVESLIELGVVVHDYPGDEPRSSELLQHKLQEFVQDARTVASDADGLGDISVPLDILGYIDHGRNPDIYSREFVELVTKQNQNVAGHIAALDKFRDVLCTDLSESFPELEGELQKLR